MADFVLLTGLSGAGRSEAAKHLEDLGWFVIDNLPTELIPKVSELARAPGSTIEQVALVVSGTRNLPGLAEMIEPLKVGDGDRVRILFLLARTSVLVARYEATRRRHPYKDFGSLHDAIEAEREVLEPLQAEADIVIDTSDLNVHELRDRVITLFGADRDGQHMQTQLMSFGYKYGLPLDVDMVIDCRFLPNPHWVDRLRTMTGRDEPVRDYVFGHEITNGFLANLGTLLAQLMPAYADEGKAYLTIAFGCTGGRHRSVAIAERVGEELAAMGYPSTMRHRDIDR